MLITIMLCCLMLYSLCAVSAEADRKAQKMYEEWKRKQDGTDIQSTDE